MNYRLFSQIGKILLLAALFLAEIDCGSLDAKVVQGKNVVSNFPVKASKNLKEDRDQNALPNNDKGEKLKAAKEKSNGSQKDKGKNVKQSVPSEYGYRNGDQYLLQYQDNELVRQIILVEQSAAEISVGRLFLLAKNEKGVWQETLQCKAFLGKNGIDKVREGDKRTPTGDYGMLMAFGAKDNPGSLISYTKLTDTMYLCGDKEYYNQFIDVSKVKHTCSNNSEHLIRYIPQYNYALIFDYNKENVFGKGSAIFLHCVGSYPYTLGCISVTEENMIKILKTVDKNARICIYAAK
ncbi:L,D-transpeptidase family protein [bacterium]|nr:L,D-transpeptidase family protein [bacterium]